MIQPVAGRNQKVPRKFIAKKTVEGLIVFIIHHKIEKKCKEIALTFSIEIWAKIE